MSTVPTGFDGKSDAELIASVRAGVLAAYGTLYERHVGAAHNLARQLARSATESDDLVSESFAKVLDILRAGKGPDSAFRAYLLATLRHAAYAASRKNKQVFLNDDMTTISRAGGAAAEALTVQFSDTAIADLERTLAAKAFARLPERWQAVLWHTEVEQQAPAEVAPVLGLTANGVSALAHRAREGLRQAYLQVHLAETSADRCRAAAERLGAWTRHGLSKRERAQVEAHLDDCSQCRSLAAELADVNSALRSVVAPIVLGGAAFGYLTTTGAADGDTTTDTPFGRVTAGPREFVGVAVAGAAIAAAVAAALASGDSTQQIPAAAPAQPLPTQELPFPTLPPLFPLPLPPMAGQLPPASLEPVPGLPLPPMPPGLGLPLPTQAPASVAAPPATSTVPAPTTPTPPGGSPPITSGPITSGPVGPSAPVPNRPTGSTPTAEAPQVPTSTSPGAMGSPTALAPASGIPAGPATPASPGSTPSEGGTAGASAHTPVPSVLPSQGAAPPAPAHLITQVPSGLVLDVAGAAVELVITVHNDGGTASGPVSTVLNLPAGFRLAGAGGRSEVAGSGTSSPAAQCLSRDRTVSCRTDRGPAPAEAAVFSIPLVADPGAPNGPVTGTVGVDGSGGVPITVPVSVRQATRPDPAPQPPTQIQPTTTAPAPRPAPQSPPRPAVQPAKPAPTTTSKRPVSKLPTTGTKATTTTDPGRPENPAEHGVQGEDNGKRAGETSW